MTKRLLQRGATGLERSLLVAGEAERPSAAGVRRAAAALGLGASVALEAHIAPKVAVNRTSATVVQWAAMALVGAAGIEALVRAGHRPAAETLGRRFLTRQPDSPLAKRIESLLGRGDIRNRLGGS